MSTKLMITLLDQANTGAEMLQILDTFTNQDSDNQPTMETIEF
jgi:hypothetical protein